LDNKRYIGRVTTGATIGTAMASSVAVTPGLSLPPQRGRPSNSYVHRTTAPRQNRLSTQLVGSYPNNW